MDEIMYDVENDFLWLKDAGVAIPVYNISEPKLPLVISENRNLFKLFFSDVGLLTSRYSNQVKMSILNKDKAINNGALFENVVAQELLAKGHKEYYFNSKKQGERNNEKTDFLECKRLKSLCTKGVYRIF